MIDHGRIVVSHLAGRRRVINRLAVAACRIEEFLVALEFAPRHVFVDDAMTQGGRLGNAARDLDAADRNRTVSLVG